ncbi:tyrosine-type recombinase/integrase [Haloparvum sp. AD34]
MSNGQSAAPGSAPNLTISEAVDLFIRRRRPEWKGETERTYRKNLEVFEEYAREADIETLEDLERWKVSGYTDYLLGQDWARATISTRQKNARTWLKFLEEQGYLELGTHLAIDSIQLEDGEESSDQMLEPEDAQRLLGFYRDSAKWRGTRRHALLEVIWHIGCRFAGIAALDVGDYDDEEGILKFRNRPESGTRLKEGDDHQRNAILSQKPKEVLDLYIARERIEVRDDEGRRPLFTSRQGRPSRSTVRGWCYEVTQPCMAAPCPHGTRRPACEYVPRDSASKCPSTRPTHAIRRGSITWQRNLGFSRETVADRAATTPNVIRRYYDKPEFDDELERRRHETEQIDLIEHLHPTDLDEDLSDKEDSEE